MIEVIDNRLTVRFTEFTQESYQLFLKCKRLPEFEIELDADGLACGISAPARFAQLLGVETGANSDETLPLPDFLFEHQREIIKLALDAQRYAVWSDCGTGKTLIELEFARQVAHRTGGRCLIITLNEIVEQTIEEARKFYGEAFQIVRLHSREEMREWCARGGAYTAPPPIDEDDAIIDCALHHVAEQDVLRRLRAGKSWAKAFGTGGASGWEGSGKGIFAGPERRLIGVSRIMERANQYTSPQIAITNYEKMNPDDQGQIVNELRYLSGLILDESSRLKAGGGKQKWALIKSSKGIPYKLSCTATPAPNDVIEFASQASFLERMRSENEIIWTFFARDPATQEWTVKRHAKAAFYEWMAAWSIYLRDPRRYGWSGNIELPPEPEIIRREIAITPAQIEAMREWNIASDGQLALFGDKSQGITGRAKLSQIAKGFVYEQGQKARHIYSLKPDLVARLIIQEYEQGLNPLVWTIFDEESEIIAERLRAHGCRTFDVLSGSVPTKQRQPILDAYRHGTVPILISKASLLGYGMNFQHCGSMIFSGWNDSFESFYQAVRRAVRYGQKRAVRIHLPFIAELEGAQLDNIFRKEEHFERSIAEQEQAYIAAMRRLKLLEDK